MPVALMDYAYIAVDGGAACMDCEVDCHVAARLAMTVCVLQ